MRFRFSKIVWVPNEPTPEIPDGTKIPDDAVITDEASLEEATSGN